MNNAGKAFGGNRVSTIRHEGTGIFEFANGAYVYYQVVLGEGESHTEKTLNSFTVFFQHAWGQSDVETNGEEILKPGGSIQAENEPVTLRARTGKVRLLIAGVKKSQADAASVTVTPNGEHYKVEKPWGHELWINGNNHPGYCLKEIFIKSGNRTSLQYHHLKEETNVLFSGKIRLFFQAGEKKTDLGSTELEPIASIHVVPPVLHRLESMEDTLLYETSTPHLDDVIRIQDDVGRRDGRIASEHGGNG